MRAERAVNVSSIPDMDWEMRKGTFFLAASISLFCVEVFGIVGNILLVRVMVRSHSVNRSYGLFLITLAVTDTLSLVMQMVDNGDEMYEYRYGHYITHPNDISCKLHDYCFSLFTTLSAWLLVCITCERFLVVFYPLRGRMWWKANRLTLFAMVVTFFCMVQAPRLYFVERGAEKGYCYFSIGNNTNGFEGVFFDCCANFFFVYGVPGTILLVLNLLIILQMRGILKRSAAARLEEYRKRYALNVNLQVINSNTDSACCPPSVGEKTRRDRQRATCILVAISCTYLIMLAPQCIARLYWSVLVSAKTVAPDGNREFNGSSNITPIENEVILGDYSGYYYQYRFLFQNFTAISYGSNFYTYFIFGKRFRAEVTRFLGSSSNEHSHPTQRANNFWFMRSPVQARRDYVEINLQQRRCHCPRVHDENGIAVTPR